MESRILVIEESLDLCRLFEYILRADGHTAAAYTTWQAAQAALMATTADLIIFDWASTNSDGYDWAQSLRQNLDTANIPILFVCGDALSHTMLEMIGELGISVIEKPFDIFVFRNRLQALLGMRERSIGAC